MAATPPKRRRLSAAERKAQLIEVACELFTANGYSGTTTASLAKAAGVTEPVIYRHFDNKDDLYISCIDESLRELRSSVEQAIADEPDPGAWTDAMAKAGLGTMRDGLGVGALWMQAVAEASANSRVAEAVSERLDNVHDFAAHWYGEAQARGGIDAARDPQVEAWYFISLGLLYASMTNLGRSPEEPFRDVLAARHAWLRSDH